MAAAATPRGPATASPGPVPAGAGPATGAPARASAWPAFATGIALVLAGGFAAYGLRSPLAKGLERVWPAPPPPAAAPAQLPPQLQHRPEEKPKPRQWTLGEVSGAVTGLPKEIAALVKEGQQELRQLEDPGELTDALRQERARNFFRAWGRTFNNRVKLLEKKMPSAQACAPFTAMQSGCRAIEIAIDGLHRATNMTTVAAARKTLEQTVKDLDLALHPPEPPAYTQ